MAVTPGLKAAAGIKKGDSMTVQRKLWADWEGLDEEEKSKKTMEAKGMAGGGNEKGAKVMRENGGGVTEGSNQKILSNDKAGQYDPSKALGLQQRTDLAESFVGSMKSSGRMTEREARSFVKKADKLTGGKVREYRGNKTIVTASNELFSLNFAGNGLIRVGKFNEKGNIED